MTYLLRGVAQFLQFRAAQQATSPITSLAHTDNPTACFTKSSSSLSPWIFDFGATNHVSGNRSLLSHIQILKFLPPITLVDGSHTSIAGIGTTSPPPTLPLSSILHLL